MVSADENVTYYCLADLTHKLVVSFSYITSALADPVLLLTILLIAFHSKLQSLTGLLTFVLCLSLLLSDIVTLLSWQFCRNIIIEFLIHFLYLNSHMWMTIYGYHIIMLFYSNDYFIKTNSPSCLRLTILSIIGFGIPFVNGTIITYSQRTAISLYYVAYYIIPTLFAVVNLTGFAIAIFLVSRNLWSMRDMQEQRLLSIMLICVRIITIFGIGWSIFLILETVYHFVELDSIAMMSSIFFLFNIQAIVLSVTYLLSDDVRIVLFTAHPKLSTYFPCLKPTANNNQEFLLYPATNV